MQGDVRVTGGVVHSPSGAVAADILVQGERIVALVARDYPVEAETEIDASGTHFLPGIVDLHADTRIPGYDYKEDFLTCSRESA